ncbi:MAG: aldolase catalytic domain-containing protein [Ruminiclostridium sp.]
MMGHVCVLDCTLRDGGYLVDKTFGDSAIYGIIKGLISSKLDWIEIGFLQDEGQGEGKTVFKNSKDAQKYIPDNKENSEFSVLADYSRYSISNLDEYTGESFNAVRACFFKNENVDIIDFCNAIKDKGYKLFIQPVDILGYSDKELLNLIENINKIEPYCFSIVDTFGSMYIDDLQRIYSLVNHNLIETCQIGFHSHNNLQMSNALSQEFVNMSYGNRHVVIDATMCGMGRGAGNTPTELVTQYLVQKFNYKYDMDSILDTIDGYMENLMTRCNWGYSTPYFIAGCYGAHINNTTYLTQKNSIRSKDIRYILNQIGDEARKQYNYDLLEQTYFHYLETEINDGIAIESLTEKFKGKDIVVILTGASVTLEADKINDYIKQHDAIVIVVNFILNTIKTDYLYFSNVKRYNYWRNNEEFDLIKKIYMSNVKKEGNDNESVISLLRYIKCGWEHMDNSAIILLRLLDSLNIRSVGIAGFDGIEYRKDGSLNYITKELELPNTFLGAKRVNSEIQSMLEDFFKNKKSDMAVEFITKSRFEQVLK